jgi:hypothetical protein
MRHVFDRHREAQMHAATVTNIPARAALRAIHNFLLEAGGLPLHFLPERYRPVRTLDVLFFYQAVERLFTEWTDAIRKTPEAPGNRDQLLRLQEAMALIPTLPTERAQTGLANFLSILRNTPVPEGAFVDTVFCSRLLSVLLSDAELLQHVLSGEADGEEINSWDD